jgi:thiosulfate reductase cytochrome b subunit|tara:strand:- start:832 stop:1665 length:834 start_codon:yes stop_codon:yes gene_type:complete
MGAQAVRGIPSVNSFMLTYPGHSDLPSDAPVGLPAWLGWQHFFNAFFLLLIIRTGWQVRTERRPVAYWTRKNSGPFRTKGAPQRMSLTLWLHLSLDFLWALNGIIFIVLLFVTGQWMRVIPLSWDVFPNAISVAIQYLSLNWPTDNGWVNYNSLQLLSYTTTIFIAAPLAIITGLRMSSIWPAEANRINTVFPLTIARAIHFPVMLWFVFFTIIHVTLVLATGALRNLNHMFASQDNTTWLGFWIFATSLVVMVAAWFVATPIVLRAIAAVTGKVSR